SRSIPGIEPCPCQWSRSRLARELNHSLAPDRSAARWPERPATAPAATRLPALPGPRVAGQMVNGLHQGLELPAPPVLVLQRRVHRERARRSVFRFAEGASDRARRLASPGAV